MPLRDISELQAWIEREAPSAVAQRVARTYIAELGDQMWKAPDVEGEHHLSIWWLHDYATGEVDILAITNR